MFATSIIKLAYKHVAKPIYFRRDPEKVHDEVVKLGKIIGRIGPMRLVTEKLFRFDHPALAQTIGGIYFRNPVGLAAGFDKNADLINTMPAVGAGFMQIGSITGEPCEGNPKPRLWRLPLSRGLVVNYGLKNDGAEAISKRLRDKKFALPVSTSVAKTNSPNTVDTQSGIADYVKAFKLTASIGDITTVNISCPNAFGGEPFNNPEKLNALLFELNKIETSKQIWLKVTPDLTTDQLDELREVADRHRVHGFIIANLTKRRDRASIRHDEITQAGEGGISGRPTNEPANQLISHLYKTADDKYTIIGTGGIFNAEDAYTMIRNGASLVQLITGMIFEGPQLIGEINKGLVELLKRDGFENIGDAVGSAHR
ncbi:MAG: quinone-dependent dihydroorotate dehydrogenase [bacterium]